MSVSKNQDQDSVLTAAEREHLYQQEQDQQISMQFHAYDIHEIEKRQEHMMRIEKDVVEVSEMFNDLQLLVNEQQTAIDTIESNIGQAKSKTENAETELLKVTSFFRLSPSLLFSAKSLVSFYSSIYSICLSVNLLPTPPQAEEYQKKARKKQCCLVFLGVVVLAVVVLIFTVFKN